MKNAPERVTLARSIGGKRWETLNGKTMSMGYVDSVEYIRKDKYDSLKLVSDKLISVVYKGEYK